MSRPRFRDDERGNMAILFALAFAVSAAVSALAVDAAALYHERRMVQAGVDLAAISAAGNPGQARAIAEAVLAEAGLIEEDDTSELVVEVGHYSRDPAMAADARFVIGQSPANAVRVGLNRTGTLHFAKSFADAPRIGASGLASVTPEVSFSVGSRLASLDGGLANAVLSKLLGTSVSLSVMDYNGLVSARINALSFLDALALELGLSAGTYDQLLGLDASAGKIAAALTSLLTGTERAAMQTLALAGTGSNVPLKQLFSLGRLGALNLGAGEQALGVELSALEILSAAAALADGDRQLSLNLGASVPGLTSLKLDLSIGEPPQGGGWFAIGPGGTVVRTAQTRLRLDAKLLSGPILLGAGVQLPLWLDMAHAEAKVSEASCPSAAAPRGSAKIAVRPGALQLAVGHMSDQSLRDFGALPALVPVRILNALLLRIEAAALVEVAATEPVTLSFNSADIAGGTLKSARTQTPIASLAGTLIQNLDIDVNVLGLGLSPEGVIKQALRGLLTPLAATLDLIIDGVFSALGLGVGEADVRVYGVRCRGAVLVG